MKYGEILRGQSIYTIKYYKGTKTVKNLQNLTEKPIRMEVLAKGTKAEMNQWQHEIIKQYTDQHGRRSPFNKSDW